MLQAMRHFWFFFFFLILLPVLSMFTDCILFSKGNFNNHNLTADCVIEMTRVWTDTHGRYHKQWHNGWVREISLESYTFSLLISLRHRESYIFKTLAKEGMWQHPAELRKPLLYTWGIGRFPSCMQSTHTKHVIPPVLDEAIHQKITTE